MSVDVCRAHRGDRIHRRARCSRTSSASGWPVRALYRRRRGPHAAVAARRRMDRRRSRRRASRCGALVSGTDAVIHCAGTVRGARRSRVRPDQCRGHVPTSSGPRRAPAHAPRFLLMSSLAARSRELSDYAASKRRAANVAVEAAPQNLRWTVLRPPAVYGPGERELAAALSLGRARHRAVACGRRRALLAPLRRRSRERRSCAGSPSTPGTAASSSSMTDIPAATIGTPCSRSPARVLREGAPVRRLPVPVPRAPRRRLRPISRPRALLRLRSDADAGQGARDHASGLVVR